MKRQTEMESSGRSKHGPRPRFARRAAKICVACGMTARRDSAKYCVVCGKVLGEDYQPLDAYRSSYRLQGRSFLVENAEQAEITNLFEMRKNPVSEMAWASFVYSMVPFLGILFVPVTFIIGICAYGISVRHPQAGGRRLSLLSIGLSFPVLGVQIFFWWLLYLIPELAGRV